MATVDPFDRALKAPYATHVDAHNNLDGRVFGAMKHDDYRCSALARFHDSALESAVLLLALARRPVHSHFDLGLWSITGVRSDVRTTTEMHSFAINARKALEIAELVSPGFIAWAKTVQPHQPGESFLTMPSWPRIEFSHSSFWWVISRIVHSVATIVQSEYEELQSTETKIYSQSRDSVFGFASDFDGASASPGRYTVSTERTHYVSIERLVSLYAAKADDVEMAIDLLRTPNEKER